MKAETAVDQRSRPSDLVEVMGLEPTASSMRPKRSSQLSYTPEGRVRLPRGRLGAEAGSGRRQLP